MRTYTERLFSCTLCVGAWVVLWVARACGSRIVCVALAVARAVRVTWRVSARVGPALELVGGIRVWVIATCDITCTVVPSA